MNARQAAPLPRPKAGFTLVELVVALGLAAILVALAVPSWEGAVLRAHRAEALRLMMGAALCQQRTLARTGAYDLAACAASDPEGRYRLAFTGPADASQRSWRLTATPRGAQARDPCGALTLDHLGRRGAAGEAGAARCWGGR